MEAITIFSYDIKKDANPKSIQSLPYMSQIGKMIRKDRKKLHLSQKEFAAKIKTTQKIISLIESGKGNPTLELLARISEGLEKNLHVYFK